MAENRRHWQVPGTPHTDVSSPVTPANEEVYRSGRLPRLMDQEFIDALNPYPLEPTIIAATESLVDRAKDGEPAAPSQSFEMNDDGELVRDDHANVTGGVRYGLFDYPLATFIGASAPGSVFGSYSLISQEEFEQTYGCREAYLKLIEDSNASQIEAGYLTDSGAAQMIPVANDLLDRLGI
ncbi:hypothetical protein HGO92_02815 [Arthrobacter sp. SF27]|nr:hypothetical protein [Arthrobacter sp. SF27]